MQATIALKAQYDIDWPKSDAKIFKIYKSFDFRYKKLDLSKKF